MTGHDRSFFGASALLFAGTAVATYTWCGSMSGGMPMPGGWTMSMAWMRMPGQSWLGAAVMFMGMWIVMMVAMMLPSLVGMLAPYRAGSAWQGALVAGAGYFTVWTLLGAAVYPVGVLLAEAEMRSEAFSRAVPVASGVVLVLAGAIQLSAWKARWLAACSAGSGCAIPPSPWLHGLRLGLHCVLCCSGFMLLLLVLGVMDLRVMTVVAVAISAERLVPKLGEAARHAGAALIAGGAFVILGALGLV